MKARAGRLCLAGLAAWAGAPAWAGNQGLTAGLYGGTLGAGGATAAERSSFGQNPAALRPHGMGLHLHAHRPFGLEDLDVAEAGVYRDGKRLGAALEWRQTRVAGWYREQAWEARSSLRLGRAWDLGWGWAWWSMRTPGRESRAFSQSCGLAWRPLAQLKVGAFAAGLPPWSGNAGVEPVLQWGAELASRVPRKARGGQPFQVLRVDMRKTGTAPWRALAALTLCPHPAARLTAGLSTSPFQFSLGIRASWTGLTLDYALRQHRYLGRTALTGLELSSP